MQANPTSMTVVCCVMVCCLPLPQECQQLGIDSGDIRGGLLGLTSELPALAGAAVESLQAEALSAAIEYYSAVTGCQQGGPAAAGAAGGLLPVLAEVREGRTEAPAAAAGPAASGSANDSSATGLQVDWDLAAALEAVDGGQADAGAAGISWDLGAAELATAGGDGGEPAAAGGISWDFEVEAEPAAAAVGEADDAPAGADGAPAEMSWDIDISGLGEAAEQQQGQQGGSASSQGPDAAAAAGAVEGGAAAAAAASADEPATVRRLVEDAAYRASLLDDLFELRAFLMQVGVPVCGVPVWGVYCCAVLAQRPDICLGQHAATRQRAAAASLACTCPASRQRCPPLLLLLPPLPLPAALPGAERQERRAAGGGCLAGGAACGC